MNIHHLELFYYVAMHGGVSAAARRIPYGIQQPAISAQIIQLENNLGAALFTRRPFKLTKAGEELFRFIEPFFSGLDEIARKLRGGAEASLRIGALETVQREYLPRLLLSMCHHYPELRFTLVPARLEEIEASLLAQEIDVGIAPLLGKRPEGIKQKELVRVPLALMVPENSSITSSAMLWKKDRIAEPLITGPTENAICRLFQAELQKRKVEWFASIELNSQELIGRYVAEGFGVGLVLVELGVPAIKGVRMLPLSGFPTIPYGLLWAGILSPMQRTFFDKAQMLAQSLSVPTGLSSTAKAARSASRSVTKLPQPALPLTGTRIASV